MRNLKTSAIAASLLCTLGTPSLVAANGDQACLPHDSGNQSPLALIHLQPSTLMAGNCLASTRLRASISNISIEETAGNEALLLDGEINRIEINKVFHLGNTDLVDSISVSLPFYSHREGVMDGFIEDWHDLTGLPEGKRINRPQDQLEYRYSDNGQTLINIVEEQSGIGDAVIALRKNDLTLAVKIPTGDENKLTGSGGTEIALWWASPLPEIGQTGFSFGAGATYIDDNKVIPNRANSYTGAVAASFTYGLTDGLNLLLSGNWQTAWYDSDIDTIGGLSGNISMGAYGYLGDGIWSFRLTEDVPTETSPDVGLVFDYTWVR